MNKVGRKILNMIIDNLETIIFLMFSMFGFTFCVIFFCCLFSGGGLFYAVFQAMLYGIFIDFTCISVVFVMASSFVLTDVIVDKIKERRYKKWMTR